MVGCGQLKSFKSISRRKIWISFSLVHPHYSSSRLCVLSSQPRTNRRHIVIIREAHQGELPIPLATPIYLPLVSFVRANIWA